MTTGAVLFDHADGTPRVVFEGEVSLGVADAVDTTDIESCRTSGVIVVDMSRCLLLDSLGIAVLLRIRAVAGEGVRLVGPSDAITKLLGVTGLDGLFAVDA